MKDTIKAKDGFCVISLGNRASRMKISLIFDGGKPLFMAKKRTYEDYQDEKRQNECFNQCEVFTTVRGNQFIYWRDEEIDADYITRVPTEDTYDEN